MGDIEREFNRDLANLDDGLIKLVVLSLAHRKKNRLETLKMLLSVAKDIRVIVIKFADRIQYENITHMPKMKQKRCNRNSRCISHHAHRLGIAGVKSKLDDLAFRV